MLKEQNFSFLYELQHFRKVLFSLFARCCDSRANRLFTASLFTQAPKEKASEAIAKYTRGWGSGFAILFLHSIATIAEKYEKNVERCEQPTSESYYNLFG